MPIDDWNGILPLVVGPVLLSLAWFVLRTGRNRVYNVVFAILYAVSGLKSLAEGFLVLSPRLREQTATFPEPELWINAAFACAVFMLPLFLLFVLLFPRPTRLLDEYPVGAALVFVPSVALLYVWHVDLGVARTDLGQALNGLSLVVTLVALGLLVAARRGTADPIGRTRASYLIGAFGATALTNLVLVLLVFRNDPFQLTFLLWIAPLVELIVAGVIGYAIVKYQVLDIELKVKKGFRYMVLSTTGITIFFLANQVVENVIIEPLFEFTQLSFLIAAVITTIVFVPLERLSRRITNRLFPATQQPPEAYQNQRSRDLYHAQVAYILRDGAISDRERKFLEGLRANLELSAVEAETIEADVFRIVSTDRPDLVPAANPSSGA